MEWDGYTGEYVSDDGFRTVIIQDENEKEGEKSTV